MHSLIGFRFEPIGSSHGSVNNRRIRVLLEAHIHGWIALVHELYIFLYPTRLNATSVTGLRTAKPGATASFDGAGK